MYSYIAIILQLILQARCWFLDNFSVPIISQIESIGGGWVGQEGGKLKPG